MEASNYQKHKKSLKARHVPGSHNVIADDLSRRNQIQHTEWLAFSLSPPIFKQIIKLFKYLLIDLFASRLNNKVPPYVSPMLDSQVYHQWMP